INNAQGANYDAVQLGLVNDSRVNFVAGSFKSTPIAVDDAYLAAINTPLVIAVGTGVLINDFDDNIPGLMVSSFSPLSGQGGTVVVNPNGSFSYTPPIGFTGYDTFTYTLKDSDNQTNVSTVRIRVQ
ncbi:MAG TPA: Ig-like domain-containing protein, partial [Saprospiraceae bacterium]|nr:Ig-like domain-containing protein [Saprospiraceae bacterium]